ncbi:MAG: thioredoxin [Candidatus Marinimicrobia bacterium]|nr:thioredoxin [Candidatus Neomarinimicrobiota bacterium]
MLIGQSGDGGTAEQNAADLIKNTDTAGFSADVIEASKQTPVIVDFWAPWCGPCKQLTPLLERLTNQYAGKVKLVKVNVDENQELAAQFRVQSIPAVYGFKDGKPVDGFMGALSEGQLKQFIERLTGGGGSPVDDALSHADALLAEGQTEEALGVYQQILGQDPAHVKAVAGALRCYIALGQEDVASELLGRLPDDIKSTADIESVKALLEVKAATEVSADETAIRDLEEKVLENPKDMQARFDLAMTRYGCGAREAAIDDLVEMVHLDREWNDDGARKQLVKFFEALGPTDPLTLHGRRGLSSVLFS